MRIIQSTPIKAADASVASSSGYIEASSMFNLSAQVVATGAPVGAVKLQFSNDTYEALNGNGPVNWVDIPSATVSVSAAGTFGIPKIDVCYNWVNVVYTKTSGTGNITVNVRANGF